MEMVEHLVTVRGESVAGGRPKPEALSWVLRYVEPAVRQSLSMAFRNTSGMPGRRPEWFQRASDIRFTGMRAEAAGGTCLRFEAPRVGEAAEELYRQGQLFQGTRPGRSDTGFDLLGDALGDVRRQEADSLRYDASLLRSIARLYDASHKRGVDSIELLGDRLPAEDPFRLDATMSGHAIALQQMTPAARRARVCGKLDMIRHSDSVFELLLDGGERVRGLWTPGSMTDLQNLFGLEVLMEGQAVYRASGRLLRLEADAARAAGSGDEFFRRLPVSASRAVPAASVRQPQTPFTGAAAVYGRWPGEETEEEILAALKEMD